MDIVVKPMSPSKKFEAEPIGFVDRSSPNEDVKDKSLISKIILKNKFVEALEGIEVYSRLFIIFWLHKVSENERTTLKVHPQGRSELPLVGVFATRAPVRPNPIGLTLVKLVKHEKNILWLEGLDAFDGTPILDIKPYDGDNIVTS